MKAGQLILHKVLVGDNSLMIRGLKTHLQLITEEERGSPWVETVQIIIFKLHRGKETARWYLFVTVEEGGTQLVVNDRLHLQIDTEGGRRQSEVEPVNQASKYYRGERRLPAGRGRSTHAPPHHWVRGQATAGPPRPGGKSPPDQTHPER